MPKRLQRSGSKPRPHKFWLCWWSNYQVWNCAAPVSRDWVSYHALISFRGFKMRHTSIFLQGSMLEAFAAISQVTRNARKKNDYIPEITLGVVNYTEILVWSQISPLTLTTTKVVQNQNWSKSKVVKNQKWSKTKWSKPKLVK